MCIRDRFETIGKIYTADQMQNFLMDEVAVPVMDLLTEFRQSSSSAVSYTHLVCGYPNAMLAKHVPAQSGGVIKADAHTNSYMLQSESV